jgi:hypothetical protein
MGDWVVNLDLSENSAHLLVVSLLLCKSGEFVTMNPIYSFWTVWSLSSAELNLVQACLFRTKLNLPDYVKLNGSM